MHRDEHGCIILITFALESQQPKRPFWHDQPVLLPQPAARARRIWHRREGATRGGRQRIYAGNPPRRPRATAPPLNLGQSSALPLGDLSEILSCGEALIALPRRGKVVHLCVEEIVRELRSLPVNERLEGLVRPRN